MTTPWRGVEKSTIMESYSVFDYTVLFGAPDTRRACLWGSVLADAQPQHLLWPCHSHWGMKLRCWHLDITAINTVNCISRLRFLLSFNINLIGIYLKENPLLAPRYLRLYFRGALILRALFKGKEAAPQILHKKENQFLQFWQFWTLWVKTQAGQAIIKIAY